jgi:hypothetical protein
MYKSFQRIISAISFEQNNSETTIHDPDENDFNENNFYNELPIDYFKRDDNDSPDLDNIYYYKFNNKYRYREFSYLHDELNKRYDIRKSKNVHLCIYAFNDICFYNREPYPFLQFLAQRQNEKFLFPSFLFECPPDIEDEDLQIHFTNNCLNKVIDFFVIEGSNLYKYATENMNRSYRGFIHDNNEIYVVYDMTNFINLNMRKTKHAEWCVLQELMDKNQTNPGVVDFFHKYKYMNTIHSMNTIPQPVALYLYDIEKREPITQMVDLLEPRSFHPSFGKFYYFVEKRPATKCIKCAVFIENMVIIDNENASKISYISDSDSDSESDTDTDSLEYSEETNTDKSSEPIAQQYSLPFTSIIQFQENEKIFCVKTESLFTYLQN